MQGSMWELVQTLLLPSLFTLAHVMPLTSILRDHPLMAFIKYQHKLQRDLLLQRNALVQCQDHNDGCAQAITSTAERGARTTSHS